MAIQFSKLTGVPTSKGDANALALKAEALAGELKKLVKENKQAVKLKESSLALALLQFQGDKRLRADIEKSNAEQVKAFKRELLKQHDAKYVELLQQLNAMKENSSTAREFLLNPKQLLQAHNLGSTRRANIRAHVEGLGKAALATLAQSAVAQGDWDMAAIVCSVVDKLPRDDRPDFSTAALATQIAGPTCEKIGEYLQFVDRCYAESMKEWREFAMEKISTHDRLVNALNFADAKRTVKQIEGEEANAE